MVYLYVSELVESLNDIDELNVKELKNKLRHTIKNIRNKGILEPKKVTDLVELLRFIDNMNKKELKELLKIIKREAEMLVE